MTGKDRVTNRDDWLSTKFNLVNGSYSKKRSTGGGLLLVRSGFKVLMIR
jgi:hypothetical protein